MRLTLDEATSRASALGRPARPARRRVDRDEAARLLRRLTEADGDVGVITSSADGTWQVSENGAGPSTYHLDDRGSLCRIVEPDAATTTFRYDPRRRLTEVVHPDGGGTRYAYDANDRLRYVDDRGARSRYDHDPAGRMSRVRYDGDLTCEYRYDDHDRLIEGRSPSVTTRQRFDDAGRTVVVDQTVGDVTLTARLERDATGRPRAVHPPGDAPPIHYRWHADGSLATVVAGGEPIAEFERDGGTVRVHLANGTVDERVADPVDGRPVRQRVRRGGRVLHARDLTYADDRVVDDGARRYDYDPLGRLVAAADHRDGSRWRYAYDPRDNRIRASADGCETRYDHDPLGCLAAVRDGSGVERWDSDRWGRPRGRRGPGGVHHYRYDPAGQLLAVERGDRVVATFDYDHRGRLVKATLPGRVERYVYGPDDELLAVADADGSHVRVPVSTPWGVIAEVTGDARGHEACYLHADPQGTVHLVTNAAGEPATVTYCPFGTPLRGATEHARFGGHPYLPELGLYWFGTRWYDPRLGRFLTPDSYTGAPDDARLVRPGCPAGEQARHRDAILDTWLRRPRVRNRYVYCGNDPVGRVDPDGHWSLGWVALSLLGAVWALPNTVIGLLLEVVCLALEVVRWLVWVVTGGRVTWEPPGFDAAASPRLNTAALVFRGGAMGSFPQHFHALTLGNVFFVYGGFEDLPQYSRPGNVFPPAYDCEIAIPRDRALYEHELRHVNQYGWLGPFFLPAYFIEWLRSGYEDSLFERDARRYAGV